MSGSVCGLVSHVYTWLTLSGGIVGPDLLTLTYTITADVHLQAGGAGWAEGDAPPRVRHPLPHHQVRLCVYVYVQIDTGRGVWQPTRASFHATTPLKPLPPSTSQHKTQTSYARDRAGPNDMPNVFAMKLRKQLRGKGLEDVKQVRLRVLCCWCLFVYISVCVSTGMYGWAGLDWIRRRTTIDPTSHALPH